MSIDDLEGFLVCIRTSGDITFLCNSELRQDFFHVDISHWVCFAMECFAMEMERLVCIPDTERKMDDVSSVCTQC